jgi:tetratricopeptide (TPR) repeat protein
LCLLATGGMAAVHLARAAGIGGFEKLLVIKRILPHVAKDQSFIQMFLDEARIAATLDHANVVHVFDVGSAQGDVFLAMEFLHGHDLRSIARTLQGPLPLDPTIAVGVGLCAGLHYAHERRGPKGELLGLVHRDVSPSNVVVTYDGSVKVIDFGIAKATNRSTETGTGTLKGKPGYMSPEQCLGEEVDRRSDVFCAGIVLYELTTGTRLFGPRGAEYVQLRAIVEAEIVPPSKLVPAYPPELEEVVLKALRRKPEERYQTALELQRALEGFALASRLDVSPTRLAAFMEETFQGELDAWRAAERSGVPLAAHVVNRGFGQPPSLGRIVAADAGSTATETETKDRSAGINEYASTDVVAAQPIGSRGAGATAGGPPAEETTRIPVSTTREASSGAAVAAPRTPPRRRTAAGALTAIGLVASLLGLGVWRGVLGPAHRRAVGSSAPSATAPALPAPTGPPYVLIFRFENRTPDPVFDDALELVLESALKRSPLVTPLAGSPVHAFASEVAPKAGSDEEVGRMVSQTTGRPVAMVHGVVAPVGAGYRLSFRANDGRSEALIVSSTPVVASPDEAVLAATQFASVLRIALGDPPAPEDEGKMGLSRSLEADHEFGAARSELSSGKLVEAILHLRHTLEIDPHFALADGALGVSLWNGGQFAEGERYLKACLADGGSLSQRERLSILGLYQMSLDEYGPAVDTFEQLLTKWPTDTRNLGNLAIAYKGKGDIARGLELAKRARREQPWFVAIRSNLTMLRVVTGDFAGAAEEARQAIVDLPHPLASTYVFGALGEAMVGKRAAALELYAALGEAYPSAAAAAKADFAALEGRLGDAAATLEAGIVADEAHKSTADVEAKSAALGEVRLREGNLAAARSAATRASASAELVTLYRAARVLISTGALEDAKKIADRIAQRPGDRAKLYAPLLRAELLRAQGQHTRAADAMKAILETADLWIVHAELAATYLEVGAFKDAEREFQTCIAREGQGLCAFMDERESAVLVPPALYGLARAKEGQHDPETMAAYRSFLALTTGADDPLVRDAQRRLGAP